MSRNIPRTRRGASSPALTEARRSLDQRAAGYREQALKILPWICGRCGREFSGRRLRELTVHHKDHDHENNPSDGSNWELLCIYCHDMEHSHDEDEIKYETEVSGDGRTPSSSYRPFASLKDLLKEDK